MEEVWINSILSLFQVNCIQFTVMCPLKNPVSSSIHGRKGDAGSPLIYSGQTSAAIPCAVHGDTLSYMHTSYVQMNWYEHLKVRELKIP